MVVGRLGRPHGIRGALSVPHDQPEESPLVGLEEVWIGAEASPRKIRSIRVVNGAVLLEIEGIADRTAAERFTGAELSAPRDALPETDDGEFYFSDLVGLMAKTAEGRELGRVMGVMETGAAPVLVIGEGANELLVPFVEQFVPEVDVEAGWVQIVPPDYGD